MLDDRLVHMQACHLNEIERHDRSNGRIYKIVYGENKPEKVDLSRLTDDQLSGLVTHANDWYVRHSRRILQERAAKNPIAQTAVDALVKIALNHEKETVRFASSLGVGGDWPVKRGHAR